MSALSQLRLRFDLPSGNPAYFALLHGVATRELLDVFRHVQRLSLGELDGDDLRLLFHGDERDRALGAAALLFMSGTPQMRGRLWKAVEQGSAGSLFISFVLRTIDPGFLRRAEKLFKRLWKVHVGEDPDEKRVADSASLSRCAELLALAPKASPWGEFALPFPNGRIQQGRERFVRALEDAYQQVLVRSRTIAG